jgi:NAD(P)-dependent dehydrogenase (short-subunit alcohol dehydrogenase family)
MFVKRLFKAKFLAGGLLLGAGALLFRRRWSRPVSLAGRVVIITGASAGIGRATAHAFAQAGARVVLVARRAEPLAAVKAELAQYRGEVLAVPADVTCDEALEQLVETALQAFGRIDVLVNNAGISRGGPFTGLPADDLQQLLLINVYGPLRLAQLVLPAMLRQHGGHIVNVSSMAGLLGAPGLAAYNATRSAIIAFSDSLRREVQGSGIYVSAVLPSWTRTPMTGGLDEAGMRAAGLLTPLTSFDPPERPAQAIVDAVRYRRAQLTMGGPEIQVLAWQNQLSPRLSDLLYRLYFRLLFDKRRFIETQRRLGS